MSRRNLPWMSLLLLAACARGASDPAPAADLASDPGAAPEAVAADRRFELTGEVLPRLIACGEPGFLQLGRDEQRASLAADPRVRCRDDGDALACAPTGPLSAFDLHVFDFRIATVAGGEELQVRVRGDDAALADGIAARWPRPARVSADGRRRALNPDASFAIRLEPGAEPGEARYACRLAAPGEDLFAAPAPTASGTGVIAGAIQYPGEEIPALRVCAIAVDDPARHRCVRTAAGAAQYRIDGLAAGDYEVWAWVLAPEADIRLLRAMQDVQCIRAPCPRQPLTITLADGAQMAQVTLNEAAANFDDAPAAPAED